MTPFPSSSNSRSNTCWQSVVLEFRSRILHLVVPNSLLVCRRRLLIRRSCLSGCWRLHESLLLRRELRIRRAVHCAISTLLSGLGRRSRLSSLSAIVRLLLDVIVCDVPSLAVLKLDVGRVGVDGDDVPGVHEAGEEAETAEGDVYETVS